MSIFDAIKSFLSGNSRSGKVYIIDAAQLSGSNSERLGPRDQVQVLQHLSRFVEKEHISVQAVFEGRALREVAHGENYGGVQVFFADSTAHVQSLFLDLVKKALRSKQAVVVTANRQVEERAISMGALTLRPSTFRKAFENGGGERGGEHGGRGGRDRRRGGRRGGGRPPHGPQGEPQPAQSGNAAPAPEAVPAPSSAANEPQQSSPQPPAQNNPPKGNDSVRDLIDLVE